MLHVLCAAGCGASRDKDSSVLSLSPLQRSCRFGGREHPRVALLVSQPARIASAAIWCTEYPQICEIPSSPASRSEASLSTRGSWKHRYGEISIDVIPDVTPIVGYIDNVGVLCAAVAATAAYIWDEHVARVEEQLSPNISDNSLNDAQATAPTTAQPSQQPVSSTARSRTSGTA